VQDGEKDVEYLPRAVVVGGNTPYTITRPVVGLPPGLSLADSGVLSGIPTSGGTFNFTVQAADADNTVVSNAYVLTVTGDVVVPQYHFAVEKFGGGSGTVAGSGIDCGTTCDVIVDGGTTATLAATPAGGSVFTGWGGACAGTGDCVVTVNADTNVSATFVPATLQYMLTVSHSGSGTVASSPKGINCGKQCNHAYTVGSAVTLTAKPAKKHLFLGWSGACSGTALTCTVPMLNNTDVTATFN
jgi:Divergent InlB B-repeat domain/Putative Ig domain